MLVVSNNFDNNHENFAPVGEIIAPGTVRTIKILHIGLIYLYAG
jgi:hypothetical protein